MLLDMLAGKPTEIHELNGALAKNTEGVDVPAPANTLMTECVLALEAKQIKLDIAYGTR